MPSDNSPIPDETRRQLDGFFRLATEVDKAITAVIPGVIDLQVAAAGGGMVAISGIAPSVERSVAQWRSRWGCRAFGRSSAG